jgi:hypothetical protein
VLSNLLTILSRPNHVRPWCWLTLLTLTACGSVGGVKEKPCQPGCVNATTRLECNPNGTPREVPCPASGDPCSAPVCQAGSCGFHPAVGAPCGPNGLAQCNAAAACLGPDLKLSAIREHTCVLADDGKVWCWGEGIYYELGDGTSFARGNPVLTQGLPGPATDVSAGYADTCAVVQGDVYCWGNNLGGQTMPDSTKAQAETAVKVDVPGVKFVAIRAGQGHTCGITTDATVYCWGNTSVGQCGVDGPTSQTTQVGPTMIQGLDHVVELETVKNHVCAVRSADPSLLCWGSNSYDDGGGYVDFKLGPGAGNLTRSAKPVAVDLGSRVVDVGMGFESTYAITADGKLYAWGLNKRGQLGTTDITVSTTANSPISVPTLVRKQGDADASTNTFVPLLGAVDVLRSDGSDQCARMQDGTYMCWGGDDNGELGTGQARFDANFAVLASALPASATKMVHGENHACIAANEDGKAEVWCYGQWDMVGNGSTNGNDGARSQLKPTPIEWVATPDRDQ